MPSRKILVILIICLGVVGAVFILQKNSGAEKQIAADQTPAISATESSTSAEPNTVNWQSVLGTVQSTTTVASGLLGNIGSPDDTTLTSQLAKDFFGRYLVAQGEQSQSGVDTSNGIDTGISDQIVSGVLSSGSYTNASAVIYTAKNLNIQTNSNQTTITNYLNTLVQNSKQMATADAKNGSEIDIINNAILNQDQKEIAKLDPIIASYQILLGNMLKAPTPKDATGLHLEFVNSISAVLSDLSAIRQTFIDPVKALSAISIYKQDYTTMSLAIQKIETYAQIKMKSFTN